MCFVPASQGVALAVALCSMVCWGSWSNFLILAEVRMKFELFYLDWSVGCFLTSLLFAFTLGSVTNDSNNYGSITFLGDDLSVGAEKYFYAFAAGLIFNVANLCLCKGISMLGLALAFPLCIGTSMVLGTTLTYLEDPTKTTSPALLFFGLAIAFAAVVTAAVMHSIKDKERAAKEPLTADAEGGETAKEDATMMRKLVICIGGGILMGCWNPLVVLAEDNCNGQCAGLSPYGEFVFYCLAVVLSSFVLIPLVIAVPMEGFKGQAVGPVLATWSKTPLLCHIYALLGGFVWSVGTWANATAGVSEDKDNNSVMNGATSFAIGQCANVAAIFWGLILWGEFNGTSTKVKGLVALVVVMYVLAIILCTLAN
jgi:glucose uptake protein